MWNDVCDMCLNCMWNILEKAGRMRAQGEAGGDGSAAGVHLPAADRRNRSPPPRHYGPRLRREHGNYSTKHRAPS